MYTTLQPAISFAGDGSTEPSARFLGNYAPAQTLRDGDTRQSLTPGCKDLNCRINRHKEIHHANDSTDRS
jgi:hypothetical protein